MMSAVYLRCSLLPLSVLENLYIYENPHSPPGWEDNIENALWLELLHPFIAVKTLYLFEKFASHITPALQELTGDKAPEVSPPTKYFLGGVPSIQIYSGKQLNVRCAGRDSSPVTVTL